jgi:hypothetical protein
MGTIYTLSLQVWMALVLVSFLWWVKVPNTSDVQILGQMALLAVYITLFVIFSCFYRPSKLTAYRRRSQHTFYKGHGSQAAGRPHVCYSFTTATSISVAPWIFSVGIHFLLLLVGWDRVHLVLRPLFGLLYQPKMIYDDDDDCESVDVMRIDRGNRSTRRKPAPALLCPPQIPHDQTRARTRAAAVGSQRLTAWAMARPSIPYISSIWNMTTMRTIA